MTTGIRDTGLTGPARGAGRLRLFRRSEGLLRWMVGGASVGLVLLFVVTAMLRWQYRYELEELEGSVYLMALRVYRHQAIYVPPSLRFIPYMYPPGYFYACASLGRVMGMSIRTMRAVSIAGTLGSFVVIYALVWREVRQHLAALAAVGLYAGCYGVCQGWFDLGRLDSFFILLVLVAMYATRWAHPAFAAVLWVMAFQTKQSILPAALAMLCCNWNEVRRTIVGLSVFAGGVAGSVWWLNHLTSGWYGFYVFTVPAANADLIARQFVMFWPLDVVAPFGLAVLVVAAALMLTRPSLGSRSTRFYLSACSLFPLYWWIRTHDGSTVNALLPVYALLAVLFGLSLARLLAWLEGQDAGDGVAARRVRSGRALLLTAALLQLTAHVYNPRQYRPTRAETATMDTVLAAIQSVPGDVYVAQHPYYELLAGKPTYADLVAIHDAARPKNAVAHDELQAELRQALRAHTFRAMFLDQPGSASRIGDLLGRQGWDAYYERQGYMLAGDPLTRPAWVMEPGDAGATERTSPHR